MTESDIGIRVSGDLRDQTYFDPLRLQRGDEAVTRAVRRYGRQAKPLKRRRPEPIAEVSIEQGTTAALPDEWPWLQTPEPRKYSVQFAAPAGTHEAPFE